MTMIKRAAAVRQRCNPLVFSLLFLGAVLFLYLRVSSSNSKTSKIYTNLQDVSSLNFDAILILGGGVPTSLYEPPVYVQQRCDDAAAIRGKTETPILTLSAGTAHLSQLLTPQGLPVWESTSSAAYLQKKHGITSNVYLETTSFDTIGNAFFARTSHTEIMKWNKLLIITNEFHMDRTKAIFDWIFGIEEERSKNSHYQLSYFASRNVGLSDEALQARREHEARSCKTVETILAPKYQRSMKDVWGFINEHHDLYASQKLIAGATEVTNSVRDEALKKSYGGA